jgi:hypothetical protein
MMDDACQNTGGATMDNASRVHTGFEQQLLLKIPRNELIDG